MSHTLVSIIIPCYNQGKYLEECIESLFTQTYSKWECIIINDGSTDSTEKIALEFCEKDQRIKYIRKENGGLSSARNAGINMAKGEYLQFLDADDIILQDKFKIQVELLNQIPNFDISISDYYPSDEFDINKRCNDRYIKPFPQTNDILAHLITDWEHSLSIPCHCFLFRSSLFKLNKIYFDIHLPNHEDWDCWMQIFSLNPRVVFTDHVLAIYRIRNSSMCSDIEKMHEGNIKALDKQLSLFKDHKQYHKLIQKRVDNLKYGKNFDSAIHRNIHVNKEKVLKKIKRIAAYIKSKKHLWKVD